MAVLKRVPLSIWLKLTFVVLIVSIVVYLISSIKTVVTTTNTTVPDVVKNEKIDVTPTMIRSIEQIGEWSFLEINDEELVDTVRRGIFSNDELVRIYYGTLRLGINLKDAKEGWLSMSGDTLVAKLPPVRLLDNDFIDEKAAICKLFSIDTVRLVSDEMLEIFGGDGYFEDSPYGPTERLYRDCRAMWLEEGAPTVQRITIARECEKHGGRIEYLH